MSSRNLLGITSWKCVSETCKKLSKTEKKPPKNSQKPASRNKDHTIKSGRILCKMNLEMLCKETASYCLTVMVFKKIEFCVCSL